MLSQAEAGTSVAAIEYLCDACGRLRAERETLTGTDPNPLK